MCCDVTKARVEEVVRIMVLHGTRNKSIPYWMKDALTDYISITPTIPIPNSVLTRMITHLVSNKKRNLECNMKPPKQMIPERAGIVWHELCHSGYLAKSEGLQLESSKTCLVGDWKLGDSENGRGVACRHNVCNNNNY